MEYTIKKLSDLAGVSTRTLRYYDEIDLLKPARVNSSGYRIYGQYEINRLQLILFYRELGVELFEIKAIIETDNFNEIEALEKHHEKLIDQKNRLSLLINNIDKTIQMKKGEIIMKDNEKFTGFKQNLIKENEKNYGKEIREKYSNETIETANQQFMNMSKDDYYRFEKLSQDIFDSLKVAIKTNNPASPEAQTAAKLHREWIEMAWGNYNKDAHVGVAEMYVDDSRFTAYYDKEIPGTAKFLRDAILVYVKNID